MSLWIAELVERYDVLMDLAEDENASYSLCSTRRHIEERSLRVAIRKDVKSRESSREGEDEEEREKSRGFESRPCQ